MGGYASLKQVVAVVALLSFGVLQSDAKYDYTKEAIALAEDGNVDGSIDIFEMGLRAHPHVGILWANTGISYWRRAIRGRQGRSRKDIERDVERSVHCMKMALVWDPLSQHARDNLRDFLDVIETDYPSVDVSDIDDYLLGEDFLDPFESMDSSLSQRKEEDSGLPEPPPLPKDMYRRTEILFDYGYRAKAVDDLCHKEYVLIDIPEKEIRQGFPSVKTVFKAASVLKICGFVLVKNALPKDLIKRIHDEQDSWFDEIYAQEIEGNTVLENANTYESTHFAIRSKGRFEFSNPLREPFTNKSVINNDFVRPIMARVMGENRIELDTFSTVTALPQTPIQHWHRDDGFLFSDITQSTPLSRTIERDRLINYVTQGGKLKLDHEEIERKIQELNRRRRKEALTHSRWGFYSTSMHLPPHGVVQFIPLRDVDLSMGPTQFVPGTQIHCSNTWSLEQSLLTDEGTYRTDFCPEAALRIIDSDALAGTSLLFDFRTLHRGGRNIHRTARRPLMYMTFFQEWYYDKVNFHQKQTKHFDGLQPPYRKLLNRLDTKRYIRQLEERLDALYVDVGEMESTYNFDVHGYDEKSQIEDEY